MERFVCFTLLVDVDEVFPFVARPRPVSPSLHDKPYAVAALFPILMKNTALG